MRSTTMVLIGGPYHGLRSTEPKDCDGIVSLSGVAGTHTYVLFDIKSSVSYFRHVDCLVPHANALMSEPELANVATAVV